MCILRILSHFIYLNQLKWLFCKFNFFVAVENVPLFFIPLSHFRKDSLRELISRFLNIFFWSQLNYTSSLSLKMCDNS